MNAPYHIADLVGFFNRFAPSALAEDWDNVGLLVGAEEAPLSAVLTCLTLTPDVAAEAIQTGTNLIVSHHPIMFRPIQRITAADAQGKMLLDLIQAGIAVYSPHTSYDSAMGGINRQLAHSLELRDVAPLRPRLAASRAKIICFVPADHLEAVQRALWENGAGEIGDYSRCSFFTEGTGTFFGSDAARPAVGDAGQLERVSEVRLEVVCPRERTAAAVAALIAAHPYEEPAYDVYPLEEAIGKSGSGRWGQLAQEITLAEFNRRVKQGLGITHLQYVGNPRSMIRRVAIACGAAAEFLRDAGRLGCDVLLTGEARFHACLEARELGMAMVLPGHYATERPAMEKLCEILAVEFPEISIRPSRDETDPLKWDC